MGLIFSALSAIASLLGDSRPALPDGDQEWTAGADDLWPDDDAKPQIASTASEPELIVIRQYGLVLPNGQIAWNQWGNMSFADPFDRLRTIAALKKTADQVGFGVEEFLARYSWVSRNQIGTVVYEDTGAYQLTDPTVCTPDTPAVVESQHVNQNHVCFTDPESADHSQDANNSDGTVRPRSVGGDAQ